MEPVVHNPYTAPSADLSSVPDDGQTYMPRMFALGGRIGRVRYLAYNFSYIGLMFCVGGLSALAGLVVHPALGVTTMMLLVPLLVLNFALHVRRLHDMNRSGLWSLFMLIPYISFIPGLYLLCRQGDAAVNEYGPVPGPNPRAMVLSATVALPAVAIAGMLAAIAIPAYQDYVKRTGQHSAALVAPVSDRVRVLE